MKLLVISMFIMEAFLAHSEPNVDSNIITRTFQLQDKMHDQGENHLCSVTVRASENIGLCVPIQQCKVLNNMLDEAEKRPAVKHFLNSLRCNVQDEAYVCCPYSSFKKGSSRRSDNFPAFLSPPNCGKPAVIDNRIIGGEAAKKGAWPWIAALGYRTFDNPQTLWFCGGVLISNQHVLTAAHCLKPRHPDYILHRVQLGGNDLTKNFDGIGVSIDTVVIHPNYTFLQTNNDIGVIKLKTPVSFTDNIMPICLPKQGKMLTETFLGFNPYVVGWGVTNYATGEKSISKLMQVQIPIVDNTFCNLSYSKKGKQILSSQICTYDKNNVKDSCQGDSGGPLMVQYENTYYVIGIVSFGYKCGEPGYPGVYSRVTSYLNWISTVIS